MRSPRHLVLCAVAVLATAPALAIDESTDSMAGRVTVIKAGKLAKFVAKPPATGGVFDLPDTGNDPTAQGGRLRLVDLGDPDAADVVYELPPVGWSGLGNPPGSRGYKYKGAGSPGDPCKVVLVKEKIVKAVCKGPDVELAQPLDGDLAALLTLGPDSKHYCTTFGGSTVRNDDTLTKRKSATAPACTCGAVPPKRVNLLNIVGTGDCGTVTTSAGASSDLECAGLYLGSGSAALSLPAVAPDSVQPVIMDVDCCAGDTLLLGATNDADTGGQNLSCTKAGCFFGAPLPIPNTFNPATSTCTFNTYERDVRGELDCETGGTRLDMPLVSATFLTGDILAKRCSGGSSPGLRCGGPFDPMAPDPLCPGGGTCVNDSDLQPCPICNPVTLVCNGGQNNGMTCAPDGGGGTGLPQYPTSHDCTVSTLVKVGDLPVPFKLTTGTATRTAAPSGGQQRVFCGFCRDVNLPGATGRFGLCTAGSNVGMSCGVTGDCGVGGVCEAHPCESDAECAGDPVSREACAQRNEGAFGPNGGANTTITEIGTPSGNVEDYGTHVGAAVSVFCIPPSFNPLIDASADLPGPGAVSLPSTIQLVSPSGAFLDPAPPL